MMEAHRAVSHPSLCKVKCPQSSLQDIWNFNGTEAVRRGLYNVLCINTKHLDHLDPLGPDSKIGGRTKVLVWNCKVVVENGYFSSILKRVSMSMQIY
jgi:hypothetical protein